MDDCTGTVHDHASIDIRGDAAHGIVRRGQHRDGRFGWIDTQVGVAETADVGQFAGQDRLAQVRGVQMDVVIDLAISADSLAGADLGQYGPGDDVPGGQIQQGRGVALHEALAVSIAQDAAFAAHRFGNQNAPAP